MRSLLLTLALASLAVASAASADDAAPAKRPPNILFLIADDLGWNDIGYHGSEILTPHLDRLAREGIRLEQHYVTPMCSSTRAGLLSGRYPSRFGVLGATNSRVFPFEMTTLASALDGRGYFTGITGKWHLGSRPEWGPLHFGFDASYGSLAGGVDQYGHFYKDGPFRRTWQRDHEYVEEEGHATDLIAREAIRWIEKAGDEPFYIQVAFTAVHIPLQEPREWLRKYDGKINDPSRKLYAACATHLDHAIADIVEALDRTGQRENTLIVFTSDNGGSRAWTGTHQYGGGHLPCPVLGDNRPLRGWKGQVYEGGVRVPAFVNWPGTLEPGETDAAIHIVDWFPTLARLAGCRLDDSIELDGRDVWDLVTGRAEPEPRPMYWRSGSATALRHGDWKLIAHRGGKLELFNLADDPGEKKDLAAAEPQRVAQFKELLEAERAKDE